MKYFEKEKESILIIIIIIFLSIGFTVLLRKSIDKYYEEQTTYNERNFCLDQEKRILSQNLSKTEAYKTTAKNIMFVAHPDDESLWGGGALYHEKYLVVCVTCGERKDRAKEFSKVMGLSEDDFIMLGYPDLVNGQKSTWEKEWDDINADIKTILESKDWDLVVTHNPDGEYGHIHHKMTNKIVTKFADHDKLNYFGVFYLNPKADQLRHLTADELAFKKNVLLPEYVTQESAIRNLRQMEPYEMWLTYDEWYGGKNEENTNK